MNPFLGKATEFIRDENVFLSLVSPEPLTKFLSKYKVQDDIFNKPVRILGMPGSGKTMLATFVEFRLVEEILNNKNSQNRKLAIALSKTGFLEKGFPKVAAVKVPMESEYRDFWELPYDENVKTELVFRLVQARVMLLLIRTITGNGKREEKSIKIIPSSNSDAKFKLIGGNTIEGIRNKSLEIEREIYNIGARLLPPKFEDLPKTVVAPYPLFDCIQKLGIDWDGRKIELSPLAILDDVHTLHPQQFSRLFEKLSRREIKFGRWIMMRHNSLDSDEVIKSTNGLEKSNLQTERDYLTIFLQSNHNRLKERKNFRSIAKDIANKHFPLVHILSNRGNSDIQNFISTAPQELSENNLKKLIKSVDKIQMDSNVSDSERNYITKIVDEYVTSSKSSDLGSDVKTKMISIMLNRYIEKLHKNQLALIEEPNVGFDKSLKANSHLAEVARLQLYQEFNRPYHYGFNTICDASNENFETFLRLVECLVEIMETKVINGKPPILSASEQHKLLKNKADQIINSWTFPFSSNVRSMVNKIADDCKLKTNEKNAPLGAGANAIGIPENEIKDDLESDEELAKILKFGLIYNGFQIQRNYKQGNKNWCLIELSGVVCLAKGLTLKRGGFLEKDINQLRRYSSCRIETTNQGKSILAPQPALD